MQRTCAGGRAEDTDVSLQVALFACHAMHISSQTPAFSVHAGWSIDGAMAAAPAVLFTCGKWLPACKAPPGRVALGW
jgi:hypothetical protein